MHRYLTRKWSSPILRDGAMQSMESSTIESKSVIQSPPTGVNLNALHVSRLNWTGPTGMDTVHLISPRNDAKALTNAVTRLGSVYAAGLRRSHDWHP